MNTPQLFSPLENLLLRAERNFGAESEVLGQTFIEDGIEIVQANENDEQIGNSYHAPRESFEGTIHQRGEDMKLITLSMLMPGGMYVSMFYTEPDVQKFNQIF